MSVSLGNALEGRFLESFLKRIFENFRSSESEHCSWIFRVLRSFCFWFFWEEAGRKIWKSATFASALPHTMCQQQPPPETSEETGEESCQGDRRRRWCPPFLGQEKTHHLPFHFPQEKVVFRSDFFKRSFLEALKATEEVLQEIFFKRTSSGELP